MMKSLFRRTRVSIAAGVVLLVAAVLSQGCLQREVKKQNPNTSNVFVEQIANTAIDKIDLLFVIDNSVSMADKQAILAVAVPEMVRRLVNPNCVDADGNTVPRAGGACPDGSGEEFNAVDDIHIGVITSSLGGHGSGSCPRGDPEYDNDDRGYLIPYVRPDVANPDGEGFLAWQPQDDQDRDALRQQLVDNFTQHVAAAGESGCGFEAPLEAWYRFLIDPQPPVEIVKAGDRATMTTDETGAPLIDGTVLEQRAAFLRPDGLVAIVVLTDENDCSAMDGGSYYNNAGFGWLVTDQGFEMPVATSVCETNPNDRCCFSCIQDVPSGCEQYSAECGGTLPLHEDRANVRCFQNKRRFGVDLLYPVSRYVEALSSPSIVDARTGDEVDNPLLRGAGPENAGRPRDPGLVFFAGIVGVPWQDVATPESLTEPGVMEYLPAPRLREANVEANGTLYNRWEVILGSPNLAAASKDCQDGDDPRCGQAPVPPLDPFMRESIEERPAGELNPISGDAIVPSTSNDPLANNINGHEANHLVVNTTRFPDGGPSRDDLQYACIFPLETPKSGDECLPDDAACDCGDEPSRDRPLCQPPNGGASTNTQYFGKAYPGTRILQVLRDFGDNSIVGSICPKLATADQVGGDTTDSSFGYNPAVQAIVDRLAEKLAGKCLPRELALNEEGEVPCEVVEAAPAFAESGIELNCGDPGREEVPPLIEPAVRKQLEAAGRCGGSSGFDCNAYQMCSIRELSVGQPGREECLLTEGDGSSFANAGFCYIDPALTADDGVTPIAGGVVDPETGALTNPIVANCPASERRLLRFVGPETPTPNSVTFVACTADAASSDAPIPTPPQPSSSEDGMTGDGDGDAGQ